MKNLGETLWAWVTEEPDGSVSLVGADLPGLGMTPLVGRDEATIRRFRSIAHAHGEAARQKVWLRRYTLAEEVWL